MMSPYEQFKDQELSLRDRLAIDRTVLANERTLLAYLRSGVALGIAGVSIMHFARLDWFWAIGVGCIPIGVITAVIGILRYRQMSRGIDGVRRQPCRAVEP